MHQKKRTLARTTYEAITGALHKPTDISFIGSSDGAYGCSVEEFAAMAEKIEDTTRVPRDLVIVFRNGDKLHRFEDDSGACGWSLSAVTPVLANVKPMTCLQGTDLYNNTVNEVHVELAALKSRQPAIIDGPFGTALSISSAGIRNIIVRYGFSEEYAAEVQFDLVLDADGWLTSGMARFRGEAVCRFACYLGFPEPVFQFRNSASNGSEIIPAGEDGRTFDWRLQLWPTLEYSDTEPFLEFPCVFALTTDPAAAKAVFTIDSWIERYNDDVPLDGPFATGWRAEKYGEYFSATVFHPDGLKVMQYLRDNLRF